MMIFTPRQEAFHTGPSGMQLVHQAGHAQRPWVQRLRVHQGIAGQVPNPLAFQDRRLSKYCRILFFFNNHICMYDYLTCESKDLKVFKSRLWRGSGPPCWKWPVSPIRTGAPSCSRSISLQATRTSTSTNKQE